MASGRLGSAKISPAQASLLYSNTSGSPASVNIQATSLSSTTNGRIGIAIDSATISTNQTTAGAIVPAGSMSQRVHWLDPLSNSVPLRMEYDTTANGGNGSFYSVSYWNGSTWYKPPNGYYGAPNWQKIDPYFLSTPSAYGKTVPSLPMQFRYDSTPSNMRWRYYTNLNTFTGQQFANIQQLSDPGVGDYSYSFDTSYDGFGGSADPYTDWVITTQSNGYMRIFKGKDGSNDYAYSAAIINNTMGGAPISDYSHWWYAPRIMGSNGLFLIQPTGFGGSVFYISDPDYALELGNTNYAIGWNPTATASWWRINTGYNNWWIGWFEYNPNDQRYYFENLTDRKIYSFSRATLRAQAARGYNSSLSLASAPFTTHSAGPWGSSYVTRPIRLGASLWWTTTNSSVAYVSEDLKNWQLATTYYAGLHPANTFNVTPLTTTKYLYAQSGVANVAKFDSNYSAVSQNTVIEFDTSISNYQRTGLVLSSGDKIYVQNYGNTSLSVTAMGFEGN